MEQTTSINLKIASIERRLDDVFSKLNRQEQTETKKTEQTEVLSFDELIKNLKEVKPSWEKEGGGIRGNDQIVGTTNQQPQVVAPFVFKQEIPQIEPLEIDPEPTQEVVQTAGRSQCVGFSLYTKRPEGQISEDAPEEVWLNTGTVNGTIPSGMDEINGYFVASSGEGTVFIKVTIDTETGEITSSSIGSGSPQEDTESSFYYSVGAYFYDGDIPNFTNYGCGSLNVTVCRKWFTASPPYWGASFVRG